jgi:DNA-binding NarL/FixJ family response regulator
VRALAASARLRLGPSPTVAAEPPAARDQARLTGREREVLALVTEGRSNGQIASALFISPKTASVHVSNILAKLSVSSRTEAATTAHRLGLLATG